VSGLAFAILFVGLIEGWRAMPDWLSSLLAVAIVATMCWTAGVLCARAPGAWAALAVAVTPAGFFALGFQLVEHSEHQGHGMSMNSLGGIVAVVLALVGAAAYVARRVDP
jgi:hypothetical protein